VDGTEEKHITPTPPESEPDYLRRARNVRKAWDELFPIVLGLVLMAVVLLLALRPDLRGDSSFLVTIGGLLTALGGYGLKRRG